MKIKYRANILPRIIYVVIYVILSLYYSLTANISGDTEVYKSIFEHGNLFNFGIEVVTPIIFLLIKSIGLSFESFLFLTLMLWLPIPFYMARFFDNPLSKLVCFSFFLTPFFSSNAFSLIRQYYGALFFFYYIFSNDKKRILFVFLMFLSHVSSIIWLVFSSKLVAEFVFKIRLYLFGVSIWLIVLSQILFTYFIETIAKYRYFGADNEFISRILGKMDYYISDNYVKEPLSLKFLVVNIIFIFIFSFFIRYSRELSLKEKQFTSVFVCSSLVALALSFNLILSVRLGFMSVALSYLLAAFSFRQVFMSYKL